MTEKEKAAAGMLYDANNDAALIDERAYAKGLCFEYNTLHPARTEERNALLRLLLGRVGKRCLIEPPFFCDYGYNIEVGENFYANHGCVILDVARVSFGDNVFIAPLCGFYAAGHPLDAALRNSGLEYARPIAVGSDVWIGGNVVVLPGVCIGDGSVIGAGSVVTRDVPAGVVAVGNPCRVLRRVTDGDRQVTLA